MSAIVRRAAAALALWLVEGCGASAPHLGDDAPVRDVSDRIREAIAGERGLVAQRSLERWEELRSRLESADDGPCELQARTSLLAALALRPEGTELSWVLVAAASDLERCKGPLGALYRDDPPSAARRRAVASLRARRLLESPGRLAQPARGALEGVEDSSSGSFVLLLEIGWSLAAAEELELAAEVFERAKATAPSEYGIALAGLGGVSIASARGEVRPVEPSSIGALPASERGAAFRARALAALEVGDWEGALTGLAEASAADANLARASAELADASTEEWRAAALQRGGRPEAAIEALERSVALRRGVLGGLHWSSAAAWTDLAHLLGRLGDVRGGRRAAETAVELAAGRGTLEGWALLERGLLRLVRDPATRVAAQPEGAVQDLSRALELLGAAGSAPAAQRVASDGLARALVATGEPLARERALALWTELEERYEDLRYRLRRVEALLDASEPEAAAALLDDAGALETDADLRRLAYWCAETRTRFGRTRDPRDRRALERLLRVALGESREPRLDCVDAELNAAGVENPAEGRALEPGQRRRAQALLEALSNE